jgi:hypothetical protein
MGTCHRARVKASIQDAIGIQARNVVSRCAVVGVEKSPDDDLPTS